MSGTPANSGRASASGTPNPSKDTSKKKKFYHPYVKKNNFFINKIANEYQEKPFFFYIKPQSPASQSTDEKSLKAIMSTDKATAALPAGWKLYFHEEDVEILDLDRILQQVKAFRDYLQSRPSRIGEDCHVDMDDVQIPGWKTFQEDLLAKPDHTLSCLAFAMHLQLEETSDKNRLKRKKELQVISARILNLDLPLTQFKSMSVENNVGSLVRIRGAVIRANEPSLDCLWRVFTCDACDNKQAVLQRDGKRSLPNECKACNKRSGEFDEDLKSYFNCCTESQWIRIQESGKDRQSDLQRGSHSFFDIRVSGDLVNKATPGTDINCTGVIKLKTDLNSGWSLYVDVVDLTTEDMEDPYNVDFTEEDYTILERIREDPDPFRLLVQSMCPKISGQEMIKAGLLLGVFSGSPKTYTEERREAHVLVVGDPGMGKSELLESCAAIAPRGIFVSSNSCTNSGLTATMGQDSAVEAGALVMADQGVCCIDELDKISATKEVLLEVMEDQIVNISKAGVLSTLSAKTSVLAAANPICGHYNKLKKVTENIKISLPILSRFDLVFIMIDKHDADLETRFRLPMKSTFSSTSSTMASSFNTQNTVGSSLKSRLQINAGELFEPLSPKVIQKWVNYVNKKYIPQLSKAAKLVIKDFYLKLRQQPFYSDIIPVTTRQLISLIRLTEARAKIDFCREATELHAKDVIEIVDYGMRDVRNITEHDILIQSASMQQAPKVSKRKQLDNFTRLLQIRANSAKFTMFHKDELKEVAALASIRNFNEIIDLMNQNGVLLMKGNNEYQFVNY